VDGDLYLALAPRSLAQLDAYEGSLYQRIRVVAEMGDDRSIEAWVYALRPEHRGRLDGRSWPRS
jgi:hypothetical protein